MNTRNLHKGQLFFLLTIPFFQPALSAEFNGSYCELAAPPKDAGYFALLGAAFRVYPDHRHINSRFTGCQHLWSVDPAIAEQANMSIYYESGEPKFVFSLEGKLQVRCDWKNRERECEFATPLPVPSYPLSCVKQRNSPVDSVGEYIDPECEPML